MAVTQSAPADDGLLPFPSSSPRDEQAACPFVRFLGRLLELLQFTDMSTAAGLRLDRALTVVFTIYGHQSSGAVSWPG